MTSYLFIALANAIVSFILFRSLYLRNGMMWLRAACVMVAFVLATPSVLFLSNYLLHIPDGIWFINFHSLSGIESSSGLVGALLGVIFASARPRPHWLSIPVLTISTVVAVMLLIVPFAKQLLNRLDYSKLENRWNNGICQQSSMSTCVPASCATVARMLGGSLTERELAIEAGTTSRGTEIWYMRRALHRHGYEIEARAAKSLKDASAPSILGVKVGSVGHVVVLMSKTDAGPEIADPLLGQRQRYTWTDFERMYQPNRVYFVIRPMRGG